MSNSTELENVLEKVLGTLNDVSEKPSLEVTIDCVKEEHQSFDNENDSCLIEGEKPVKQNEHRRKLRSKKESSLAKHIRLHEYERSKRCIISPIDDVNTESTENSLRILCNNTETSKPSKFTIVCSKSLTN